jgi:hypothetical protein
MHTRLVFAVISALLAFHVGTLSAAVPVNFQRLDWRLDLKPLQIANADLNQDGVQDILCLGQSAVKALYGQPAGGLLLNRKVRIGNFAYEFVVADFNSDLRPDIAVLFDKTTQPSETKVKTFLSLADGRFIASATIRKSVFLGLAASDMDGDGLNDLAIGHSIIKSSNFKISETDFIQIWKGLGNGSFQAGLTKKSSRISELFARDLNNDHLTDLIAVQDPAGPPFFSIYFGESNGNLSPPNYYRRYPYPNAIDIADYNNDGLLDLGMVMRDKIRLFVGTGGKFFNSLNFNVQNIGPTVGSGDLNGDGIIDIVTTRNIKKGFVRVFYGEQGGGYSPVDYPVKAFPSNVLIADFNGDRKLDITVSYENSPLISTLYQN